MHNLIEFRTLAKECRHSKGDTGILQSIIYRLHGKDFQSRESEEALIRVCTKVDNINEKFDEFKFKKVSERFLRRELESIKTISEEIKPLQEHLELIGVNLDGIFSTREHLECEHKQTRTAMREEGIHSQNYAANILNCSA